MHKIRPKLHAIYLLLPTLELVKDIFVYCQDLVPLDMSTILAHVSATKKILHPYPPSIVT